MRPADVDLFDDVVRRAGAYLRTVKERRVTPEPSALSALSELESSLPETPTAAGDVIALLDRVGSPATVVTTGGRYYGFVTGGVVPAALAAGWMVSMWDQCAALRVMSPVGAVCEDVALGWVQELLGLPQEAGGAIVTGATMANFTGLAAARHELLRRGAWNVERDGLFGAPALRVIVGDEAHVSIMKALGFLGLGRERVTRVPVDAQGRMRVDHLPDLDDRTIVCIQAGNVNTGAFDPASEICARAQAAGAWVHVDGAFGLWAAASPRYRHLTLGFERADSWATDGHKWPNVGYDCGIAIVRRADALGGAMSMSSTYFAPGVRREPSQYSPEMSRRARGVELWAALRSLGRQGMAEVIERTAGYAQRFAARLTQCGYEILNDVVINQVLVSFGTPEETRATITRVQEGGVCWCGETQWQGRTAMRISVSSWATSAEDVEASVAAIHHAARAVRSRTC
jgi:glutamate/tyrosine decarboxylase-like PLP-dependent enzyme